MESRRRPLSSAKCTISIRITYETEALTYFEVPSLIAGTPPPCLISSASLANASKISAWRRESFTSRAWSSNETTRYSTYRKMRTMDSFEAPLTNIPHHPTTKRLVPCPWLSAISLGVAFATLISADRMIIAIDHSTSIPQERTWLATFLAPGQSSGVPIALNHM